MIFKITRRCDKWGNFHTTDFNIVEKEEFNSQTTRYADGSMTEVEYHEASNMIEVREIVVPCMFEDYTEHMEFLITARSILKAESTEVTSDQSI